ncbi:MAG: hypothetical protein E6J90_25070 [Deltaproteobacteria bacterium]|nr:MAG: hypothetical protein E6J90_25070 [Deltaproteobacteria bacterium]
MRRQRTGAADPLGGMRSSIGDSGGDSGAGSAGSRTSPGISSGIRGGAGSGTPRWCSASEVQLSTAAISEVASTAPLSSSWRRPSNSFCTSRASSSFIHDTSIAGSCPSRARLRSTVVRASASVCWVAALSSVAAGSARRRRSSSSARCLRSSNRAW